MKKPPDVDGIPEVTPKQYEAARLYALAAAAKSDAAQEEYRSNSAKELAKAISGARADRSSRARNVRPVVLLDAFDESGRAIVYPSAAALARALGLYRSTVSVNLLRGYPVCGHRVAFLDEVLNVDGEA